MFTLSVVRPRKDIQTDDFHSVIRKLERYGGRTPLIGSSEHAATFALSKPWSRKWRSDASRIAETVRALRRARRPPGTGEFVASVVMGFGRPAMGVS